MKRFCRPKDSLNKCHRLRVLFKARSYRGGCPLGFTDAGRIEKYDYAPRAYFEAVVNALIHRDYLIIGSEIHVDMYDDRMTIWSPGGMFGGGTLDEKDIGSMESRRRNPILADLFSRLLLMERRGSGLRKMIAETEKLFGYKKQFKHIFHSTRDEFRVTFWNLNHVPSDGVEDTDHVTDHVTDYVEKKKKEILVFCYSPKSRKEIMNYLNLSHPNNFRTVSYTHLTLPTN